MGCPWSITRSWRIMEKIILTCCWMMLITDVAFGSYECIPGEPTLIDAGSDPTGYIYSPGYKEKKNYPNYAYCRYQINAYSGMHIRLKFNHVDIELSDSCEYDSLSVVDFDDAGQGSETLKLCGSDKPFDVISEKEILQLIFESNAFITATGFNISYGVTYSKALCPSGYLQCRNRKCTRNSMKCNGNDDCGDGTDEENCGISIGVPECGNPEIPMIGSDRIVGGEEVNPGSWPWMADLHEKSTEPSSHICGGTLINAQWVLSAAHCFEDLRSPSAWRVHLGNHDKFKKDPFEQVRHVERIVIFDDIPAKQFESNGKYDLNHDVALMKLNAPVRITKYVRPACIPETGTELETQTECYATGWGYTRGTGSTDFLKQAYHPIQPTAQCRQHSGAKFSPATMICAGSLDSLQGVCSGDSGGPLSCQMDEKWYVFGVASYVSGTNFIGALCGLQNHPSVFNKVSAKSTWITRMVNKYTSA